MIKHYNYIKEKETKVKSNFINGDKGSVTDKSKFRPEIASARDKAIQLAKTGGGNVGLYDSNNGDIDHATLKAMSYARKTERDITEIESAKQIVQASIEKAKKQDIEKAKDLISERKLNKTLQTIADNTAKQNPET